MSPTTHDPASRTRAWTALAPLDELTPGGLKSVARDGHQLLLARTEEGEVHVLDNRCPHEGYPLSQGDLKGCVLTCCWHNWKFDVQDGSCVLGGEAVRSYPARLREGVVEADLSEPDPAEIIPGLLESFREGMGRHENGRALRDGVRLLGAGYDPRLLLADVAAWDGRHAEYGSTHALAVSADCGHYLSRYRGVDALYALAPAIDLCGESNVRQPERPLAPPLPGADESKLRAAVEAEDVATAEGLLRGALSSGVDRGTVESWLYGVASDHFTDFGHQLIYLVKAQELLEHATPEHVHDVYVGLLYGFLLATREDTLPYMGRYVAALAERQPDWDALFAGARDGVPFDPAVVRDAVLDGTHQEAVDAVYDALRDGVPAPVIARALVGAAAWRLARFDVAIDSDPEVAEGWLWATHRLTFASAVRNATERHRSPDVLRFLFQAVAFIHSGRKMDLPPSRRPSLAAGESVDGPDAVLEAIAAKDVDAAVARAAALLRDGQVEPLRVALEDVCLRDPYVRPIVLAHAIKTTLAAFEEWDAMEAHPDRAVPVLATVRLMASPVVERQVHTLVATSLRWVADGRMPRKLTQ